MQVAADVAQGLQYIHHFTAGITASPLSRSDNRRHSSIRRRPIHDRIKASSIVITEIDRRAKICHFGAVELARGTSCSDSDGDGTEMEVSEDLPAAPSKVRRSGSAKVKLEGTRGYIAPEVRLGGSASQKSDVFAFGVVLLELITGDEPVKYTYDGEKKGYEMVSLIESARRLMGIEEQGREVEGEMASCGEDQSAVDERRRRIRSWVDRRLKDSFPVEVAERAARVALDCVQPVAEKRPDMVRVAAKLSALLMQSKSWAEQLRFPEEQTVSLAPR
ncbi:unnamed protein product [Spirodela intermedia]|nr:unnamed protein product [Spirodela intermedia]CAA6655511.1 unnamed protein product [Spirodela intermedia]